MVENSDTLSLIEFIADRYGIDLHDYDPSSVQYMRRELERPENREKLSRLKQMHRFVETEK